MTSDPLPQATSIPLYAIPTTAGTGSEVTPYATLWDKLSGKKYSLNGESIFPNYAIIDPDLCEEIPKIISLSTGLDAINQAAESIWNKNATSSTLELAYESICLGVNSLQEIINGSPVKSDIDSMCKASLLAGLAISKTKTAICHSISYPLTGHFNIPHGLACAFTMEAVLRINVEHKKNRFDDLACLLIGKKSQSKDLVEYFQIFLNNLNVRNLIKEFIPSYNALLSLRHEMFDPDRSGNSLVNFDDNNIEEILYSSWHGNIK